MRVAARLRPEGSARRVDLQGEFLVQSAGGIVHQGPQVHDGVGVLYGPHHCFDVVDMENGKWIMEDGEWKVALSKSDVLP